MESSMLLDTEVPLQPLLQAAEASRGSNISTIRSLVMRAISDKEIFCGFDQIILIVGKSLSESIEGEKMLQTLHLFSNGTYDDYEKHRERYVNLTEAQVFKLRQLTAMSVVEDACCNRQSAVSYLSLRQNLQLADNTAVEDVLVSCINARVLAGELCQRSASLFLNENGPAVSPRDVTLTSVDAMIERLRTWKDVLAHSQVVSTQIQAAAASQLSVHNNWNSLLQSPLQHHAVERNTAERGWDLSDVRRYGDGSIGTKGDPMEISRPDGAGRRQKRGRGSLQGNAAETSEFGSFEW
ncbi:COP9 SigNalosome subunit 7 [Phaeodactylum tricornutum CCAP 1055/1]|jgi:COP9 signalosome complex subunit 7|uniref:COP9 SigNalosome subunit 7 n=2 Tax=Phaeodactylum tricornutum TaxID=2850 RepID=B7GCX3_PHATC|nr:COP9 SigNalosome subunit 7 [Phaeodactylum tricornutum CCAP 1055/1]EEC43401.1 COP9 SigNalosome subunit 7 [Phaeodactylum tricornutum CCAP 1055/1]|eukprot:XP_002184954.1 COP9 SigNalosome subunit 7 [Phaeodactylum tricornutum CCAP 1055/1]